MPSHFHTTPPYTVYTQWRLLHLHIMPPYTHTNDHVLHTHTHTQRRLRHITTPFTLAHNTALYTPQWRIIQKYNIIHITMPFTFTQPLTLKTVKRLTHNNVLYTHQCLSQLHPTPPYRRKTNLPYTHNDPSYIVVVGVVVVNFDALEQANDFRIERRQVVFLCSMKDSNLGSQKQRIASKLNAHSQTDWAIDDQAKDVSCGKRTVSRETYCVAYNLTGIWRITF